MMTKAQSRGVNYFELFSNSPMWWMTTNLNPSGNNDGADNNLESWNYQQHAIYLASIALKAKDSFGVTFTSVEPFNEPIATYWVGDTGTQVCNPLLSRSFLSLQRYRVAWLEIAIFTF
jgi:galactan endo-1,6-beta-galactosidase